MEFKLNKLYNKVVFMTEEQRHRFSIHFPEKVYHTEKNISIVVALLQLFMIITFLSSPEPIFRSFRSTAYFFLYIFLFVITFLAIVIYTYSIKNKK